MSTVRTGVGMSILLGLVLSALLWVAAQPAHAQTVDECQADIAALRVQTQNATFIGQNAAKDQASLIGKLDSASAKLSQGKFQDALANLQSFRAKVVALDQQGKIAHEDALALTAGAEEAIACMQGLVDAQAAPAAA
jgi:type II secretory pathway component HofQ